MERAIVGFRQDDRGDWIADLDCGHSRHVRHRPPFEQRPWVLADASRRARIGTPIECGVCAQDAGGEAACFAQAVCAECGAVLDGGPHRSGCAAKARTPESDSSRTRV